MNPEKEDMTQQILDLEAEAASLMAAASKLRKRAVKKFCPYKVGQFIKIKRQISPDETAKIVVIKYEPGDVNTIDKQWTIRVEPWLKDLSRPKKNIGSFQLLRSMEFEAIPDNQKLES